MLQNKQSHSNLIYMQYDVGGCISNKVEYLDKGVTKILPRNVYFHFGQCNINKMLDKISFHNHFNRYLGLKTINNL